MLLLPSARLSTLPRGRCQNNTAAVFGVPPSDLLISGPVNVQAR